MLGDESTRNHGGIHSPNSLTCGRHCKRFEAGARLVHFRYRGFMDAVIKDTGSFKGSGMDGLRRQLLAGEPGTRIKLLALSSVAAEKDKTKQNTHEGVEFRIDLK